MKTFFDSLIRAYAFQIIISLLSFFFFLPSPVYSGLIRVTPIMLILDKQFKSGMVTVINEGDEPLDIEIMATEWTQDGQGKDQYKETKDIIFFPKILKLGKDEERIVRAGVKSPAISAEKTYRLFIKEMPKATTPEKEGTQIKFALQFAVPIFVKPLKEEVKGEIKSITHETGKLKIDVHNTGNTHFRIESIKVKGLDSKGIENFSKEIAGWYVLAGATRPFETMLTQEVCLDTAKVSVEIKSEQLMLHDEMDIVKTLCLP